MVTALRTFVGVFALLLPDHWRAWLQAPEGRDSPFVKSYRRDRFAYTILVRNPDIPGAHDAYLVQENRLVELFFGSIFPARGWAPDALLLERVAELAP